MGKGAKYERHLCKQLSHWMTGDPKALIFWRSSMSGGQATIRRRKGKKSTADGDIVATDPAGHLLTNLVSIEAKCGYKGFSIQSFLDTRQKKTCLEGFIEQCIREREESEREGFWLIVKVDLKHPLIFVDSGFHRFARRAGAELHTLNSLTVSIDGSRYFCYVFEEFLETFTVEHLRCGS